MSSYHLLQQDNREIQHPAILQSPVPQLHPWAGKPHQETDTSVLAWKRQNLRSFHLYWLILVFVFCDQVDSVLLENQRVNKNQRKKISI